MRADLRELGSEDRISGVWDIRGGKGDDVLIGDAYPNHLSGGDGVDRIVGLDGDDRLVGADCEQVGDYSYSARPRMRLPTARSAFLLEIPRWRLPSQP